MWVKQRPGRSVVE